MKTTTWSLKSDTTCLTTTTSTRSSTLHIRVNRNNKLADDEMESPKKFNLNELLDDDFDIDQEHDQLVKRSINIQTKMRDPTSDDIANF
mmetsp:Transcript_25125/g.28913  ORF Transcript_25125/g.28913 Transcript_25125/m.28913 type:complete len:89 (-) Transcript_25125:10-276(-)